MHARYVVGKRNSVFLTYGTWKDRRSSGLVVAETGDFVYIKTKQLISLSVGQEGTRIAIASSKVPDGYVEFFTECTTPDLAAVSNSIVELTVSKNIVVEVRR